MEQEMDYRHYSYTDLLSAREGIDQNTYPDRTQQLDALITQHPENPNNQSTQHNSQVLRKVSVNFHGKTGEYFAIWIVNLLLTIVTLGIYSAWATVRTHRYFYANTEIDGHRFSYLAQPLQILKGRIIGVLLLALYFLAVAFSPLAAAIVALVLFLATPIFICMSLRFRMKVSAYRNIRFNFTGRYGRAFLVFVLLPIMSIFTLYLALPWVLKKIDDFIYSNITYGDKKMQTELSTSEFYTASLGAFFIGLGLLLVAIFGFGASVSAFSSTEPADKFTFSTIMFMVAYVLVILLSSSFYAARIRNHIFNNMQLTDVACFESTLSFTTLVWLRVSNFIALIVTLGFALPWIKIRTSRVYAQATQVNILPEIAGVIGQSSQSSSAIGEEVANIFDMDVGLG
ncbi:YjgN family protein [Paraglaciecola sp.]|uniref:YjgN family protein n=1 Tax=Paraglaciecola sp. TaxID=1920173 RepID=UPI0030F41B90